MIIHEIKKFSASHNTVEVPKSCTVPPRTIDPFAASLPRDLLAGFPRYSCSKTFFFLGSVAVWLQSCRGKVHLGKTSVKERRGRV